jgi:3-oxoacyl-[acyl-carrier protein] reductase
MQLQNQVAIVTGASRGIGAAIARKLASEGASVVVNYSKNAGAADAMVAEIEKKGGRATAIQADMADLAQIERLFARTMEIFGRLDILVNNAGVAEFLPLDAITAEHYNHQFGVNVFGLLFATQQAARLIGAEGGRIINISSGAAQSAPPTGSVYSATKAAGDTITRSLAAELGPRRITVNTVSPGFTDTDMLHAVMANADWAEMVARTPLGRIGTGADIADVVAFLASDQARWVTGQIIGASGGLR